MARTGKNHRKSVGYGESNALVNGKYGGVVNMRSSDLNFSV
jgi:hypothetical protein